MPFVTIIPLRWWVFIALALWAWYNWGLGGLVVAVVALALIGAA